MKNGNGAGTVQAKRSAVTYRRGGTGSLAGHPGTVREQGVYSVAQAARILQVGTDTVLGALRRGRLRGAKIGGQWRIHGRALVEFLDGARLVADEAEPADGGDA